MIYRALFRPLLFLNDPESAHEFTIGLLSRFGSSPLLSLLKLLYGFEDSRLVVTMCGLKLRNPFMLAAGLDKYGTALPALAALGFAALEVGSVTALDQPGNPRPRIFRLPRDHALINRMGFPSAGAEALRRNVAAARSRIAGALIGINIGKNKETPLEGAHEDYKKSYLALYALGDYFVINVSSPNTANLRQLQDRDKLEILVDTLLEHNRDKKPLLIKISPDLEDSQLQELIELCMEKKVSGVIATNTTISRDGLKEPSLEQGGLSGAPLHARACRVVARVKEISQGSLPIVGVGGIFSLEDVLRMFQAGASAVQLYTSLVYEGPGLVRRLKRELISYLSGASEETLSGLLAGKLA